jgi:hypothetical protein
MDVQLFTRHAVEVLPDRAGEDLPHVVGVAEQIGGRHDGPGRDLPREVLRREIRHLDIAALDRDQLRALAEQRRVQMQLDIELGGKVALEAAQRFGPDVLVGEDRRQADAPARLGAGADDRRGGEGGSGGQHGPAAEGQRHGRFLSLESVGRTLRPAIRRIKSKAPDHPAFHITSDIAPREGRVDTFVMRGTTP